MASLVAIPVYNEAKHLGAVLEQTLVHPVDILVVDDGSTDATPQVLDQFPQIRRIRHNPNRGYGAALRAAFDYGCKNGYEVVLTMDSDGQHEPKLIPEFLAAIESCDIVSGSRYLREFDVNTVVPIDRRRINLLVTDQLNACFDLELTDSFCGFKAYRTSALRQLHLTEPGYGMPLELWVQAACLKLSIREIPVPLVYLDMNRSFGEQLDDADRRLAYYQEVIDRAMAQRRDVADCGFGNVPRPVLAWSDS